MTTLTGYDKIASSYNNNLKQLKKDLDSTEKKINKTIDSLYQRQYKPTFFQKIFDSANKSSIENLKAEYKQTMEHWNDVTGSEYPNVLDDKGTTISYESMVKEISPFLGTKDGYYHIPDNLCTNDFSKELRKDLEDYFKKKGSGIPIGIGKKLEEIYQSPGKTWIHRTQIDIDSTNLLSDIAKNGLICTANDIENTATPCSTYPFFVSYLVYSYQYRQGSCLGDVILKTDGEPDITDGRIDKGHVVGYIGNDYGDLHDFITRDEMANLPALERSAEPSIPSNAGYIDNLIQEARDEIMTEQVESNLKSEPVLDTEPEL